MNEKTYPISFIYRITTVKHIKSKYELVLVILRQRTDSKLNT